MPINLYTSLEDDTQMFYDKVLLVRALPNLLHDKFGQQRPLPTKNTKNIKFRKYNALSVATTALSEGTTPAGSSLSITDISASVSQYGDFITVSDVATWVSRDAVLTEAAEVLGEQSGQSIDQIYRDILVAGTSVRRAGGAANRTDIGDATAEYINTTDMDVTIRGLKRANAKFFTKMVNPSTGIATTPIRASYWAITHPDVEYTLEGLTGFVPRSQYPSGKDAMDPFEIGAYKNIRFCTSTQAKEWDNAGATATTGVKKTGGNNADIYATLVFGREAYGIVPLTGHSLENIVKPLGSAGSADPLNQRATSGWKAMVTAKILNDAFMYRMEHCVPA